MRGRVAVEHRHGDDLRAGEAAHTHEDRLEHLLELPGLEQQTVDLCKAGLSSQPLLQPVDREVIVLRQHACDAGRIVRLGALQGARTQRRHGRHAIAPGPAASAASPSRSP